jgi:hypothetical protein
MGSLQPAQARTSQPANLQQAKRSPAAHPSRPLASRQNLIGDPWLFGLIVPASVQSGMTVTAMGPPNYHAVAELMRKPGSSVVNHFALSEEAPFGLETRGFRGAAVTFVQTITFGTLTAELR